MATPMLAQPDKKLRAIKELPLILTLDKASVLFALVCKEYVGWEPDSILADLHRELRQLVLVGIEDEHSLHYSVDRSTSL